MRHAVILIVLLALAVPVRAQLPADSAPVISGIEIHRSDVFDSAEANSWLTRLANRLHIRTREGVVRRELLLDPGEPYDSAQAAETARNLRALGIFRQVQLDTVRGDSGLVLQVITRDGWSTRPDFRFRSTGGQAEYKVAFIEDNLLGTATHASVAYRKTPDRTSTEFGFFQPRLLWREFQLELKYEDLSDGRRIGVFLGRPFYSLSSPAGFLVGFEDRDERVLRFFNGQSTAGDSLHRDYRLIRTEAALALRASPQGYLRAGVFAQAVQDRYRPAEVPVFSSPVRTTYAVGPFIEWRDARYVLTRSFQGFGREEDVDVSTVVRVAALAAPAAFNYERDGIAPFVNGRAGAAFPGGFLFADVRATSLFTAAGLDSGSVTVGGTVVLQLAARHNVVLHGDAGWIQGPLPGQEFDLGLGTGPRAFGSHAFTGDRTFYTTAEYRYTLIEELWQVVGIGLAAFVDYGGAWYAGQPRRTGWDAGVGVRLGASRASGVEAIRVDLARRFANDAEPAGWVLVVGKGLSFSLTPGGNRGTN